MAGEMSGPEWHVQFSLFWLRGVTPLARMSSRNQLESASSCGCHECLSRSICGSLCSTDPAMRSWKPVAFLGWDQHPKKNISKKYRQRWWSCHIDTCRKASTWLKVIIAPPNKPPPPPPSKPGSHEGGSTVEVTPGMPCWQFVTIVFRPASLRV